MQSENVTKSEITFSGNTFNFDDLDKIEGILQQVPPPAEDEEEKQPEETQEDQPPIEPEPMKLPEPLQTQPILTKSVVPERQFATKGGRRHAPPLPKLTVNVQQPWMGQQAQWAPHQPQRVVKPKAVRKNKATLAQEEEYLPPGEEKKRKRKKRQEEKRALKGGFGRFTEAKYNRSARQMFTALSRPLPSKWIECVACGKWRKIPGNVEESQIPDPFECRNNIWDHCRNSCAIPQEEYVEEEVDQGGYGNAQHQDYNPRPRKRRRTYASRSSHSIEDILNDHSDPEYAMRRKQFYDELAVFLGRQPEVNQLCGKPVDLYHLYTETSNRGGYERVCDGKAWRQIFRTLPQFQDSHTSASYALKKMYRRNLLEYENHHLGHQA